jgi:hypothetical protein
MPENVHAFSDSQPNQWGSFGILGENRPLKFVSMKFVVIVTPKGTSLSKTASFEPLRVKIGRPVRPVHDIKKLKKKSCNFTIWGSETPGAIAMNFILSRGFTDAINCAKYDLDRPRGFQPADP